MALTLRDWSGMRCAARSRKKLPTFVLFEKKEWKTPYGPLYLDVPVAWAIAEWDQTEFNIMIYVRRDKRRLGYGTRLLAKAKKYVKAKNKTYFVFPDQYNELFFRRVGEKV